MGDVVSNLLLAAPLVLGIEGEPAFGYASERDAALVRAKESI